MPGKRKARSLSIVFGLVLMSATTVFVGAVVGSFVLGLGEDVQQSAPQAVLEVTAVDDDGGQVRFVHENGDALHSNRTKVLISRGGRTDAFVPSEEGGTLTAGDETTYNVASDVWTGSWRGYDQPVSSTLSGLQRGQYVTVTLVDTESEQIVYRETVVVRAEF